MNRREFLKNLAAGGAAAAAGGCATGGLFDTAGAPMARFAAPPMERVRFGVIGLGQRGMPAVRTLSGIPGAEVTAMCDLRQDAIDQATQFFREHGEREPKAYTGAEGWKALCDDPDVDFVYNCTPWEMHVPPAVRAMQNGKHAGIEVPAASTVDEAWELVETAERTRRHCMMLENGAFNERRMSAVHLCHQGVLGDVFYGEAYYAHDLRSLFFPPEETKRRGWYSEHWRIEWFRHHRGNTYPTHGLGSIAQIMDVNRGDQFDYLVSMETPPVGQDQYARAKYGEGKASRLAPVINGDLNTTMIKTKLGKTIYLVHDVTSPRPGRRVGFIQGTRGCLDVDPDFKIAFERNVGDGAHEWLTEIDGRSVLDVYRHPYWRNWLKHAVPVAARDSNLHSHNDVDAMFQMRLVHCLRNGLPLPQDVYDLAAWSCICELTERSVMARSKAVDVPDFTRGAWRTTPRLPEFDHA